MPSLKVAKPDTEDFQAVLNFFNACEIALESRKFSLNYPQDSWEYLDDDDPEKKAIIKIRKNICDEDGDDENDLDNRKVMYEYLLKKFDDAACAWRRVYWAAELIMPEVTDHTVDHLEFHPGLEIFHVMPEM